MYKNQNIIPFLQHLLNLKTLAVTDFLYKEPTGLLPFK